MRFDHTGTPPETHFTELETHDWARRLELKGLGFVLSGRFAWLNGIFRWEQSRGSPTSVDENENSSPSRKYRDDMASMTRMASSPGDMLCRSNGKAPQEHWRTASTALVI